MNATAYLFVGLFSAPEQGVQPPQRTHALTEYLGRPLLYHQLDALRRHGIRRAVICLAHGVLPQNLPGETYRDMELVRCEVAPAAGGNLDTAQALRTALLTQPAELALCLRCEVLTNADFGAFLRWFARRSEQAALLLVPAVHVQEGSDHRASWRHSVATDAEGRVRSFEAGHAGQDGQAWISTGICLLRPGGGALLAAQNVQEPKAPDFFEERTLLEPLVRQGQLCAFHTQARLLNTCRTGPGLEAGRFLADEVNGGSGSGEHAQAAVFLDRDGTVIVEKHYLHDPAGVELLPGVVAGLRRMAGLGLRLVLVSNQSGVGRGYFGREDVERVNGRLVELLAAQGLRLDALYLCPHAPTEACDCRKPLPGLITRASRELGLNPAASFVIGDKLCDVDLGLAVQATTILVTTGYGKAHRELEGCTPHHVAAGLEEAAQVIETALRGRKQTER